MINSKPFLRWAGSKKRLIPKLLRYWGDGFTRYVEPFMGSAALFFAIKPSSSVLSDINLDLVETFCAIQAHPRAVFIEGGAAWTKATAERYKKSGGQKLLFVCGTAGCRRGAARAVELLLKAGVDVRLIWLPTAGHDYPPAMGELIAEQLAWIVDGDPRWQ